MKNTTKYRDQNEFRVFVQNTYLNLIKFKNEEDLVSFNEQLLKILPEIKEHINKRLITAIKNGHFSKGKYQANDFIDQLFIEAYTHIDEVKEEKSFYLWLFKKTNELLDDIILKEEFDTLFFRNIDNYSKPEWDEMVEKFSTDGDGDLLMIEELDDHSYPKNDYVLNHVFIEDTEKELTEKLDEALSKEEVNRHINSVLHNFPSAMHTVFDLFTNQQFTLEEISEIRNCSIQEVEELLNDARINLKKSFSKRYLMNGW